MEKEALRALYSEYRRRFFADPSGGYFLPPVDEVTIEWTTRATASVGLCYPARKIIRLSWHYHARYPEEVGATLLHEMIHLIVPGHGKAFYQWMEHIRRLGGTVHRYAKGRPVPAKWVYTCLACGDAFRYARRLPRNGAGHRCRRCGPERGLLREERL